MRRNKKKKNFSSKNNFPRQISQHKSLSTFPQCASSCIVASLVFDVNCNLSLLFLQKLRLEQCFSTRFQPGTPSFCQLITEKSLISNTDFSNLEKKPGASRYPPGVCMSLSVCGGWSGVKGWVLVGGHVIGSLKTGF